MIIFRKVLGISNIVLGIGLLILLHFVNISDKFSSIMLMSLFIGWIFPYIALVLSGIGILIQMVGVIRHHGMVIPETLLATITIMQ